VDPALVVDFVGVDAFVGVDVFVAFVSAGPVVSRVRGLDEPAEVVVFLVAIGIRS
jgi:hypothetical protein